MHRFRRFELVHAPCILRTDGMGIRIFTNRVNIRICVARIVWEEMCISSAKGRRACRSDTTLTLCSLIGNLFFHHATNHAHSQDEILTPFPKLKVCVHGCRCRTARLANPASSLTAVVPRLFSTCSTPACRMRRSCPMTHSSRTKDHRSSTNLFQSFRNVSDGVDL
jgi:hypothetical protein